MDKFNSDEIYDINSFANFKTILSPESIKKIISSKANPKNKEYKKLALDILEEEVKRDKKYLGLDGKICILDIYFSIAEELLDNDFMWIGIGSGRIVFDMGNFVMKIPFNNDLGIYESNEEEKWVNFKKYPQMKAEEFEKWMRSLPENEEDLTDEQEEKLCGYVHNLADVKTINYRKGDNVVKINLMEKLINVSREYCLFEIGIDKNGCFNSKILIELLK